MEIHAIRLKPNQDLKEELNKFSKDKNIQAGAILTCVGSLKKLTVRLSNEQVKLFKGNFEIVSLIGTLSQDGNHTHISVSDNLGHTIGGHLKKGCIIHTTAEIVIIELKKFNFSREFDHQTGFKELVINNLK